MHEAGLTAEDQGPTAPPVEESAPERNMRETGQAINGWFIARYSAALMGIALALITPASVTLALRVGQLDPEGKAGSLALVAGIGALVAVIANPIFGALSDRSVSRFGQRKPYLIGGVVFGSLAVLAIGFADSIAMVAVGWAAAQLAFNAAFAAMYSILPERIPNAIRGKVSGLMGMTGYAGVLIGVVLAQVAGSAGVGMFLWPALVGLALVLPFALTLREVPKTRAEVEPIRLLTVFGALWINPFRHTAFGLAWAGRFLVWISLYLLTTYKTYFLIDHLGYNTETVAPILTIATLILAVTISVSSITGGLISDKIGRRKPFVTAAALLFAVAMSVVAFSTSVEGFLIGVALSGLAQGLFVGVDYALVAQVLPNSAKDAGRGMGVFNLSSTIPQTVAPVIAPALLMIGASQGMGNYVSLYLIAAVFAVLGAVAIQLIRGVR